MQNKTNFLGYLITPIILGLHWYTQHTAFLYVFGVMSVLFSIVLLLGIAAMVFLIIDNSPIDKVKEVTKMKPWTRLISVVLQIGAITYLLYVSAFITATLFIVQLVLVYSLLGLIKYAISLKDAK